MREIAKLVRTIEEAGGLKVSANEAGRIAYETFARALHDGAEPGPWEKLPIFVRRAWDAAALAAVKTLRVTMPRPPKDRPSSPL